MRDLLPRFEALPLRHLPGRRPDVLSWQRILRREGEQRGTQYRVAVRNRLTPRPAATEFDGGNGRSEANDQPTSGMPQAPLPRRQGTVGTEDANGHDGHARPQREPDQTRLKGLKPPVEALMSLRKDDDRLASLKKLLRAAQGCSISRVLTYGIGP